MQQPKFKMWSNPNLDEEGQEATAAHEATEGQTETLRAEVRSVLKQEFADMQAGRHENAVLIEALTNNWSANQLRQVAGRRGKHWRFLSALTDQLLQAEGWALLSFAATAFGMDMAHFMVVKTLKEMDRLDAIVRQLQAQDQWDDSRQRLISEYTAYLEDLGRQQRQQYMSNIGKLLGG